MRPSAAGRIAGLLAIAAAAVVALAARGFVVGFVTDPIGPRALPWLAAALLALGGAGMMASRPTLVAWPPPTVGRELGLALLTLAGFALLVEPLGFVAATALLAAAFARLFGARWRPALATGAAISLGLYLFFGWGLGVPLPPGLWLTGW